MDILSAPAPYLLLSIIFLFLGLLIGYVLAKFRGNSQLFGLESELARAEERLSWKDSRLAELEQLSSDYQRLQNSLTEVETRPAAERRSADEKLQLLQNTRESFQDSFKALSADALKNNNKSFMDLATASLNKFQEGAKNELEKKEIAIQELVKPLKESLEKVDFKIEALEKTRVGAFSGLSEQIKQLADTQASLRNETGNLVKALRTPNIRGRWGEIQLRRVVEMAGMIEYCDFVEQESVNTEEGRLRPDLIIKLPNSRSVIVDSKVSLNAYLSAAEAPDEESRRGNLQDHARQVRTHLNQLSSKAYWQQFQPGPDFVVLFLPGETMFNSALEYDPQLIEFGVERRVLLSTPTSLIGLLRVIAYGWRQDALEKNAKKLSELGSELYDRVRSMTSHFVDLRKGLERSVESYNGAVGSFERRVLVSARKFKDYSATISEEIPLLDPIEKSVKALETEAVGELESPPVPPPLREL